MWRERVLALEWAVLIEMPSSREESEVAWSGGGGTRLAGGTVEEAVGEEESG